MSEEERTDEEETMGTPISLPPEQAAVFAEAVEAAQAELDSDEEETGEEEAGEDVSVRPPSPESFIVPKVAAAAGRTGQAARSLLAGIGQRIEAPGPPDDDLSDLFEGPDMDRDNDVYIKDLVAVSEEDVFGDGGGDMSDILEVTDEDVMGDEDPWGYGPTGEQPRATYRRTSKKSAPAGLSGIQA